MDLIQTLQEQYIQEFTNKVRIDEFLINLLVVAVLVIGLRWFYIRYGTSITNRRRFANNFLPLALGTLLIIMIVKSSIALSLGLVGALSIVRFRAAIKEPEELTYLFMAIGLGLAGGANQPVLAVVSFVCILTLLYFHQWGISKENFRTEDRLFVDVDTDLTKVEDISTPLSAILPYVELKRLDTTARGMHLSFLCKADNLTQISQVKDALTALSPQTHISIIEQPDLLL